MKRLKDVQIILTTTITEETEENVIYLIRTCKDIISTRPQFDYNKIFKNNMKQIMRGQEKNEEGKIISNSTATANVSKKTIKKTKQDIRDGKLPFMITVNESGEDLIQGEDTITLVDVMKSPLQFDTDSIVVKDKNGNLITGISPKIETTDTGQKMSLTIPDNKKLTITYEATLNAAPDTDITVNNKAYWFGHSTTVAMIDNITVRYHDDAFAGTTSFPAV